jgi:hypothetical protein
MNEEYVCPYCAREHNPQQMLSERVYGVCASCRLPQPLDMLSPPPPHDPSLPSDPFEILVALFGDFTKPMKAVDVTRACQDRRQLYSLRDRIAFPSNEPINAILACVDPSPGYAKQLRIRYRVLGRCGVLVLDTAKDNCFPSPVIMIAPKERFLKISKAHYGHPKGRSSTGAMSVDVTEVVQGAVDLLGGSYLSISRMRLLYPLLGDPCPGYTKDLRIEYEIFGRTGRIERDELHGHLKRRVFIEESPIVSPLIMVESCTYGITPFGKRDKIRSLEREIFDIKAFEHKLLQGEILSVEDAHRIKNKKQPLIDELTMLRNAPTTFLNVTSKMQTIADLSGTSLLLDKLNFDPNAVFGNPLPGIHKLLEVSLVCYGHDSERLTDSVETTKGGYPRNFITNKNAKFFITVEDDPVTGRGLMREAMRFEVNCAAPIIHINRASYGNFEDVSKLIDCTSEVQGRVQGACLCIEEQEDLNKLFTIDPCPGMRKQLRIDYVSRGFIGNIRVREKEGLLAASVSLGYMPIPPKDT